MIARPMNASSAQDQARPTEYFGTFQGVFRPTMLTILGAMFYLREGWLVGNNGLVGAIFVIVAAYAITGTTALCAASLSTNHRVRPGGAFAIISQALGLEAGGAIGLPLYIAQTLSSAMYLYAFSEAWLYLFPSHNPVVVAVVAFAAVAALAWSSAALVFRAQGVMLVVVGLAIVSAFAGVFTSPIKAPVLFPVLPEAGLVESFAIFFPAAAGVLVGVGMSGQLADPRRSIPSGTLGAWAFTLGIYLVGAVWYGMVGRPVELMANKTLMIDKAAIGSLVLLGLLSSTLTAALSSLVAAPRLLQAMAQQRVVPQAEWLEKTSASGEPRNALIVTLAIGAAGLLTGSLDAIAPVITAFFILTYLALNAVVLLEQQLAMISFRPTFQAPPWVPGAGVALCGSALFLASPRPILLLGLGAVLGIYVYLARRELQTPWETVRSGVDVALASWAARRASGQERAERSWKPDLLVPITDALQPGDLEGLLRALALRNGSVKLLRLGEGAVLDPPMVVLRRKLQAADIYVSRANLTGTDLGETFQVAIDAMQGDLFPPNLVLVDLMRTNSESLDATVALCAKRQLGLAVYVPHPEGGQGQRRRVDVWLSDRHPDWSIGLHETNLDLPVLLGFLLATAWQGRMTLVTAVHEAEAVAPARRFLSEVCEQCRLPENTGVDVSSDPFMDHLRARRNADIHLFGLAPGVQRDRMLAIAEASGGACLFLMDSGRESALA